MANYTNIVPFILKEEGGLSKSTDDSASKDPVPDGTGYHTNKGVTWTTWKSFANSLGYNTLQASIKAFYAMSSKDWGIIFKSGYWDKINGDQIKLQALADVLVNWAYMSGPGTAISKLQQFIGLPMTYVMDAKTLTYINGIANATDFVSKFTDYNKQWLLSLPNQSKNYDGWSNRLNALKSFVLSNTGKAIVGTIAVAIGLGILAFFFS
ncbi:hypothetical protein WSM22_02920 [Cytophagales bacterium WSM2-2]|nr:hypothetical protein WSM22_02920 [Cytophagales bacterium WSM2-2]